MKIMLYFTESNLAPEVLSLVEPLELDRIEGHDVIIDKSYSHILKVDCSGLSLAQNSTDKAAPTRVDFLDKSLLYRRDTSGKSSSIAKAIGLQKWLNEQKTTLASSPQRLHVIDVTAGLGKDAFLLASLGCKVSMVERSPIIHALLADGFHRGRLEATAETNEALERMTLIHGEGHDYLKEYAREIDQGRCEHADVIYLDPMFPPRRKAAKVKKDIALLQEVLGVDEDFIELLSAARNCAKFRVVVKRPGKATGKVEPKPSFQINGKTAHFDVYT